MSIFIVLAALFGLSLCGYNYWEVKTQKDISRLFDLASAESEPAELCMDEPTRERLRAIMFEALDEALKDHIVHLFEVWMKDDRGQPDRARVGVKQGIRAHQSARRSAEAWMPQPCAG